MCAQVRSDSGRTPQEFAATYIPVRTKAQPGQDGGPCTVTTGEPAVCGPRTPRACA
ncbi:hypothetical protein [Kitasatospora sp. NPDC093679]|uniref:hypothetical protein n=1 Tax=Kitasatospora sp. NPDC093679 TaxID=3154983 RepID=UPI00342F0F98